jgi:hypothetical protein
MMKRRRDPANRLAMVPSVFRSRDLDKLALSRARLWFAPATSITSDVAPTELDRRDPLRARPARDPGMREPEVVGDAAQDLVGRRTDPDEQPRQGRVGAGPSTLPARGRRVCQSSVNSEAANLEAAV